MSIQLMATVFMADFEDLSWKDDKGVTRKSKASTVKLMLLAYADHANDEGEGSYPGYTRLERKTLLSRQGIADTLEAIRQNNFMTLEGWSKLDTHNYSLNKALLESLVKPLDSHQKTEVKPLDSDESSHLTPTSQATRTESSSTSSTPLREDVEKLTPEELSEANAMVTAIIANAKKVKYENRDKIPEQYLALCDSYVEVTGQKPTKRVLIDWLATFSDWVGEGLQPRDIQAAYKHATRPDGGFLVGRPGSLTNTAVALKSKTSTSPQVDSIAVERTKQLIENKTSGEFVPRPSSVPPPSLVVGKMQELSQKRGTKK